jgi:hypothetical protein
MDWLVIKDFCESEARAHGAKEMSVKQNPIDRCSQYRF